MRRAVATAGAVGGPRSGSALFGQLPDGRTVHRLAITAHGLSVHVLTYGATIQDVRLDGVPHPLILGYATLDPYLGEGAFMGALVGRFANRIGHARAVIAGQPHRFDPNWLGRHTLHGGREGTARRVWRVVRAAPDSVTLTDTLPDGHMGFPGTLIVEATYRITPGPALEIEVTATTDRETICSFATHGYWNLDGSADIRAHVFQCGAASYAPVNRDLIPTGPPAPVVRTRHDWRVGMRMEHRLYGGTIDESLTLSDHRARDPQPVARLAARGGPTLRVETTEPAMQVYAGGHLAGIAPGLAGRPYGRFAGLALEPQVGPDAPNHPGYADPTLRPGERYRQVTRFVFS